MEAKGERGMKAMGKNRNGSLVKSVVVGLVCAIVATLALTWLFAWLMQAEKIGEGKAGLCVAAILTIASFLGAMVAASAADRDRLLSCALSGLCYLIVLLSTNALFFGGQYTGVGVTLLLTMGPSLGAALLGLFGKKNKYKIGKSIRR